MSVEKGTIAGIGGSYGSGLYQLAFEDGSVVHISSGYGVRALASCFGATEGTGDLQEKIKGQEIYYSTDFVGVLESFTPVDEASEELVEAYENNVDSD